MSRARFLLPLVAVALALTPACAGGLPPSAGMAAAGDATVTLTLRFPDRALQAAIEQLGKDDVDRIALQLFPADEDGQIGPTQYVDRPLNRPISFTGLKHGESYDVAVTAMKVVNLQAQQYEVISDPSAPRYRIDVGSYSYQTITLPVKLKPVTFAGAGQTGAGAVDFVPGGVGAIATVGMVATLPTGFDFERPAAVAVAPDGPFKGSLFIADAGRNEVVRWNPSNGYMETVVGQQFSEGTQDGSWETAELDEPSALAVDPTGSYLYVGSSGSGSLLRVDLRRELEDAAYSKKMGDGLVTAYGGLAVDADQAVYMSDPYAHVIKQGVPEAPTPGQAGGPPAFSSLTVTTIAGVENSPDGGVPQLNAMPVYAPDIKLNEPRGLTIGPDDRLYVADRGANAIRQLRKTGAGAWFMLTLGNNLASPTALAFVPGVVGRMYVAESANVESSVDYGITIVDQSNGDHTPYMHAKRDQSGRDGLLADATLSSANRDGRSFFPMGIAFGPYGRLFFTDAVDRVVRERF